MWCGSGRREEEVCEEGGRTEGEWYKYSVGGQFGDCVCAAILIANS